MTLHAQSAGFSERDAVREIFGLPETGGGSSFEFESGSLSGLTAFSTTPDIENVSATVSGAYFIQDNATGISWVGRYVALPATPFTAILKIIDMNLLQVGGFLHTGLTLGVATPGAFDGWGPSLVGLTLRGDRYTNPTTFSSNFYNVPASTTGPCWVAIRVNSSTSVDYLYSQNGYIWSKHVAARNPGLTLGSIGFGMKSETASGGAALFEFFRLYNSALTFPGVA